MAVCLALWLIFYAGNLSILQNIGVFILSVVFVVVIAVLYGFPGLSNR